jgi:hypothetical protein
MAGLPFLAFFSPAKGPSNVNASKEKRTPCSGGQCVASSLKFNKFLSCSVNTRWLAQILKFLTSNFLNSLFNSIFLGPNIFWAFYSSTCNLCTPLKVRDVYKRAETVMNKSVYIYMHRRICTDGGSLLVSLWQCSSRREIQMAGKWSELWQKSSSRIFLSKFEHIPFLTERHHIVWWKKRLLKLWSF